MIHFNAELWNNHQLCVLQVLNEKETKAEKFANVEMSRHNFIMSRHNIIMSQQKLKITSRAMSQQEKAELKLEVKIFATFHNFVTT